MAISLQLEYSEQLSLTNLAAECESGAAKNKLVRYSAAQITLDIVGDLLSMSNKTMHFLSLSTFLIVTTAKLF